MGGKGFCRRTSGGVEGAVGIDAHGPKIGRVCVGEQGEFGREFEAAVAADRHAVSGAFQEFIVSGLTPAAGVVGERGGGEKERKGGGGEKGWGKNTTEGRHGRLCVSPGVTGYEVAPWA